MFDLRRFMEHPEWMNDANCRGVDPALFFSSGGAGTSQVKAICRQCDVQAECLAYALNNGEHHGVWGGMSERERRRIRRQHAANSRGPLPPPQRIGAL